MVATAGLSRSTACRACSTSVGRSVWETPRSQDGGFGQREGAPREPGDSGCREHAHACVQRAPPRAARRLHGERDQSKKTDDGQRRPGDEQEPRARVAPHRREPGERQRGVDHRRGLRDVPEREDGRRERQGEPDPRGAKRGETGRERKQREHGRAARTGAAIPRRPSRPLRGPPAPDDARAGRAAPPGAPAARPACVEQEVAFSRGAGVGGRRTPRAALRRAVRRSARRAGSIVSALSMAARSLRGRSPRRAESGGAPAAIAAATSGSGTPQNGWLPVSPSQSITPTAQTSLRPSPPCRRAARARCTRACPGRRRRLSACPPRRTARARSRARGQTPRRRPRRARSTA